MKRTSLYQAVLPAFPAFFRVLLNRKYPAYRFTSSISGRTLSPANRKTTSARNTHTTGELPATGTTGEVTGAGSPQTEIRAARIPVRIVTPELLNATSSGHRIPFQGDGSVILRLQKRHFSKNGDYMTPLYNRTVNLAPPVGLFSALIVPFWLVMIARARASPIPMFWLLEFLPL